MKESYLRKAEENELFCEANVHKHHRLSIEKFGVAWCHSGYDIASKTKFVSIQRDEKIKCLKTPWGFESSLKLWKIFKITAGEDPAYIGDFPDYAVDKDSFKILPHETVYVEWVGYDNSGFGDVGLTVFVVAKEKERLVKLYPEKDRGKYFDGYIFRDKRTFWLDQNGEVIPPNNVKVVKMYPDWIMDPCPTIS